LALAVTKKQWAVREGVIKLTGRFDPERTRLQARGDHDRIATLAIGMD
jgi:hypothetical protein